MKKLILIMCCLASVCYADKLDDEVLAKMSLETRQRIFNNAEKEWPGNYAMMVHEAERQFEAYIKYEKAKIIILAKHCNDFNNKQEN